MKQFRLLWVSITPYGKVETIESNLGWTTIVSESPSLNGVQNSGSEFEARAVHQELVGRVWDVGQSRHKALDY